LLEIGWSGRYGVSGLDACFVFRGKAGHQA